LLAALGELGPRGLTIIANGPNERTDTPETPGLVRRKLVRKAIVSFPVAMSSAGGMAPFEQQYRAGEAELETVPQGTLAERIRAGGAGIGAFYTPTGVGTPFAEGKEQRAFNGEACVLEYALRADFALVRAHKADELGNLVYRRTARNFNPIMASAAACTIVEVDEMAPVGALDPEAVVTPGIFVKRIYVRG
jgi:3-oxoadipate CoA-transferase alpha subunit